MSAGGWGLPELPQDWGSMGCGAGFGQSKEQGQPGFRIIWRRWGHEGDGNRLCLKWKRLKLENGPIILFSRAGYNNLYTFVDV